MGKYENEIIIYWSNEDQVFVAEAPELPGCMAHGETEELALKNIKDAIQLWIDTGPGSLATQCRSLKGSYVVSCMRESADWPNPSFLRPQRQEWTTRGVLVIQLSHIGELLLAKMIHRSRPVQELLSGALRHRRRPGVNWSPSRKFNSDDQENTDSTAPTS